MGLLDEITGKKKHRPTNVIQSGDGSSSNYSQEVGDPLFGLPDWMGDEAEQFQFLRDLASPVHSFWKQGQNLARGGIPEGAMVGGRHGLLSESFTRGNQSDRPPYNFAEPGGRYSPEWSQAMYDNTIGYREASALDPTAGYFGPALPGIGTRLGLKGSGSSDDEQSALDEYYDLVEQSTRDNAATARQSLKDYAEYGMAQFDADALAFGEQVDEQEAAKIGLLQESADQRKDDYDFMVQSMGGAEAAAQTYLADMGIRDPAAFTQEPLNETQALLGTSYRAGAEAGLQIQSVLNFTANQIQNINMSNMTTSRANMLVNTALQASSIQKWLNDSLLTIEMKKLEGKIKDEEQAKQLQAVAGYAKALSGSLGLGADEVVAMDQFDLLDDWANQMWKPDEPQATMMNYFTGQELPNQEVLDQLKAFQMVLDIQEQQMLNQELGVPSSMSGG